MEPTRYTARLMLCVCARHGRERARCKSSCQVFAEPKARSRARASTVRRGLEEAPSKCAGRRTGTGDEVWHTRDERARAREVLHPQGVCLIHPASRRGTFGVLPWEICWWSRRRRTEGGESRAERPAEVSRGYRRPDAGKASAAPQGRKAGQQRGGAATCAGRRPERCPERG
jgi:hypothetical protein